MRKEENSVNVEARNVPDPSFGTRGFGEAGWLVGVIVRAG